MLMWEWGMVVEWDRILGGWEWVSKVLINNNIRIMECSLISSSISSRDLVIFINLWELFLL